MKVDEFVAEALLSIIRGVTAAQADPDSRDMVGRLPVQIAAGVPAQFDYEQNTVTMVDFDLATTVEASGGGRAGITVLGADLGGEGKRSSSAANRIKFAVSLGIPGPAAQKASNERIRYENSRQTYDSDDTNWKTL